MAKFTPWARLLPNHVSPDFVIWSPFLPSPFRWWVELYHLGVMIVKQLFIGFDWSLFTRISVLLSGTRLMDAILKVSS